VRLKKLTDDGRVKRKKIAASQVWTLVEDDWRGVVLFLKYIIWVAIYTVASPLDTVVPSMTT
jgi:hypothetical protein